jgi:AsmA protein
LRVAPLTARLPSGELTVKLDADASKQPPTSALTISAPALPASTLLALLGRPPGEASGNVQTDIDISGSGETPHAIAASMNGHIGLAMVNGSIDNNVFEGPLANIVRAAKLPVNLAGPGRSNVRCLATRIDINHGEALVRAFLLDTTRLTLFATGSADLGRETWALSLRPTVRVSGPGIVVPVSMRGSFANPQATLGSADAAAAAAEVARLLGDRAAAAGVPAQGDECPRVLALARGGRPGAAPAAAPAPAAGPKGVKLKDLLKGLLH